MSCVNFFPGACFEKTSTFKWTHVSNNEIAAHELVRNVIDMQWLLYPRSGLPFTTIIKLRLSLPEIQATPWADCTRIYGDKAFIWNIIEPRFNELEHFLFAKVLSILRHSHMSLSYRKTWGNEVNTSHPFRQFLESCCAQNTLNLLTYYWYSIWITMVAWGTPFSFYETLHAAWSQHCTLGVSSTSECQLLCRSGVEMGLLSISA